MKLGQKSVKNLVGFLGDLKTLNSLSKILSGLIENTKEKTCQIVTVINTKEKTCQIVTMIVET